MLMIETYNDLPTLKYSGKYPSSIVSPPDTGKTTPLDNRPEKQQQLVETKAVEEANGRKISSEDFEVKSSPVKSISPRPTTSPRRRSTISPSAGRSPSHRLIDSYRPGSPRPTRQRENRRSRSREGGHQSSATFDRYSSSDVRHRDTRKVDTYIPSDRKRSTEDSGSNQGREKRSKNEEGEMSEGEIR